MLSAFKKSLFFLLSPKGFLILLGPLLLSLLVYLVLGFLVLKPALNFILHFIAQYLKFDPEGMLASAFGSVGIFILLLVASPFLLRAIASLFADRIVNPIEKKHFSDLPPPLPEPPLVSQIVQETAFALKSIAVNIPLLFVVFIPVVGACASMYVNGRLLFREYYAVAARRRLTKEEAASLFAREKGAFTVWGIVIFLLSVVPVVGVVMPFISMGMMTYYIGGVAEEKRRKEAGLS